MKTAATFPMHSLERVVRMGGKMSAPVAMVLSVALHGGIVAYLSIAILLQGFLDWHGLLQKRVRDKILEEYQVDLVKEPEPKPPVEDPKPVEPEVLPAKQEKVEKAPAPPAAAQAGQILSAPDTPNQPLDFTGAFVQGTSEKYVGGATAASGTATVAARSPNAVATGVVGGTGTSAGTGVDRSRGVTRRDQGDWNCPFPPEADVEQIDLAYAVVEVSVRPDGSIERVGVIQDPGHGFGREARSCAMRQSFLPALDPTGTPLSGKKQFRVKFERSQ